MKIQVLGGGCARCHELADNVKKAIAQTGIAADFEVIADPNRIAEAGVLVTPALTIDGQVKSAGKVLSAAEVAAMLKGR